MDAIEALTTRSSAKSFGDMLPTRDHLDTILHAAVRAPDHGRLRPWRFMLIEGNHRKKFGDILAASALRRVPTLSAATCSANTTRACGRR
jgi:nitroreductase